MSSWQQASNLQLSHSNNGHCSTDQDKWKQNMIMKKIEVEEKVP